MTSKRKAETELENESIRPKVYVHQFVKDVHKGYTGVSTNEIVQISLDKMAKIDSLCREMLVMSRKTSGMEYIFTRAPALLDDLYNLKYIPDSPRAIYRLTRYIDSLTGRLAFGFDADQIEISPPRLQHEKEEEEEEKIDTTKKKRDPTERSETFAAKTKEWIDRGFPADDVFMPFSILIEELKKWYCSTLDEPYGLIRYGFKHELYSQAHGAKDITEKCDAVISHSRGANISADISAEMRSMCFNTEFKLDTIKLWAKYYPYKLNRYMENDIEHGTFCCEDSDIHELELKVADVISACGRLPSCAYTRYLLTGCHSNQSLAETLAHNGLGLDRFVEEWALSYPYRVVNRLGINLDNDKDKYIYFVGVQKKVKTEVGMRLLSLRNHVHKVIGVNMTYDVLQMISDFIIQIG